MATEEAGWGVNKDENGLCVFEPTPFTAPSPNPTLELGLTFGGTTASDVVTQMWLGLKRMADVCACPYVVVVVVFPFFLSLCLSFSLFP